MTKHVVSDGVIKLIGTEELDVGGAKVALVRTMPSPRVRDRFIATISVDGVEKQCSPGETLETPDGVFMVRRVLLIGHPPDMLEDPTVTLERLA